GKPGEIDRDVDPAEAPEDAGDADFGGARNDVERGKAEIERERTEQHRAEDGRYQNDAATREPGGKTGANRDGDREDRQESSHDLFVAAQDAFDQRRQQRHHDDADQPEPAHHQPAPPQARLRLEFAEQLEGRARDIAVNLQVGGGFTGG